MLLMLISYDLLVLLEGIFLRDWKNFKSLQKNISLERSEQSSEKMRETPTFSSLVRTFFMEMRCYGSTGSCFPLNNNNNDKRQSESDYLHMVPLAAVFLLFPPLLFICTVSCAGSWSGCRIFIILFNRVSFCTLQLSKQAWTVQALVLVHRRAQLSPG